MASENEKWALNFVRSLRSKVEKIGPQQRMRNDIYFRFIIGYLKEFVEVKKPKSKYSSECNTISQMLVDSDYMGISYTYQNKIVMALNFLEQKILENDIEDLIVEWDKHTMYDVLTLVPVD